MQVLAYGLWRVWKCRNAMVFQGTVITQREQQIYWLCMWGSFGMLTPRVQHKWEKPRPGVVKVNCDGTWNAQTMKGGYGWVIRDFVGWMLQAGGKRDRRYGSALIAEVDAIRAAVVACQQGGFSHIIVESDSLSAIQMVKGDRVVDAEVEGLLFDIHAVTRELQEVTFTYAPRSCNMAAHEVAAFACRNGGLFWWDFIPPKWLFNTLACEANVTYGTINCCNPETHTYTQCTENLELLQHIVALHLRLHLILGIAERLYSVNRIFHRHGCTI
ncbi:hypothetical protein PRUPE_2G133200 [Prunus persica]|uniref:RNase H type-1 domain-containing protein n=1 Tax=Prunus persica TaxID=3760 RepID=A0A251QFD7_PRUPE|nr:hypothetical protein PRUPE_2G133200 [Prunus persica]